MDEELRYCTLRRASSLWGGLPDGDLNYLKEFGVKITDYSNEGCSFQATNKQFLDIIDHFRKVVVDDDEITIYDDYLE